MPLKKNIVLEVGSMNVWAQSHQLLRDISFQLLEQEILTIVGPSGSGKSTLLRVLNRLADLENGLEVKGTVLYRGKSIFGCCSIDFLRTKIGILFQRPCIFPGSITKNVLFGVRHHQKIKEADKPFLIEAVLRKVHLWEEVKNRLNQSAMILSIGQKQRLAFARVLAVNPDVLLLDEPTSSLDPYSTRKLEETILELKNSKSIILVTHSTGQGEKLSDRMLFLSAAHGPGQIIQQGHAHEILKTPQAEEIKRYLGHIF
jgi:phosphate transport system ATP-binding protein